MHKDVVPEPGFPGALELRQVEIGAGSPADQLVHIVEKVQTKVDERGGDGLAVDEEMVLGKVQATGAHEEHRDLVVEPVFLGGDGMAEGDGAMHCIEEVLLALHDVRPSGGRGVLKIGHKYVGTRV